MAARGPAKKVIWDGHSVECNLMKYGNWIGLDKDSKRENISDINRKKGISLRKNGGWESCGNDLQQRTASLKCQVSYTSGKKIADTMYPTGSQSAEQSERGGLVRQL